MVVNSSFVRIFFLNLTMKIYENWPTYREIKSGLPVGRTSISHINRNIFMLQLASKSAVHTSAFIGYIHQTTS